jgi:uncharacterized protein (UPF0335 family)
MTDKQSEAVRLADEFEATKSYLGTKAAAELRRLEALNAELVEALNNIIEEPKNTMSDNKALREIVRIAKAALAKAEGRVLHNLNKAAEANGEPL